MENTNKKKWGSYYTPNNIVNKLTQNALSYSIIYKWESILAEKNGYHHLIYFPNFAIKKIEELNKKNQNDIISIFTDIIDKNIQSNYSRELNKSLIESIKNIKIVDNSCGDGRFIIEIVNQINRLLVIFFEKNIINQNKLKDLIRYIVNNNIYGFDLNQDSIENAKKEFEENQRTQTQSKFGNMDLIIRPKLFFKRNGIFSLQNKNKQIRKNRRKIEHKQIYSDKYNQNDNKQENIFPDFYDLIIGNPPYGNLLSDLEKKLIKKQSFYNLTDVSAIFFQDALLNLTPKGVLCYILPKSAAFYKSWEDIRKKSFDERILQLYNLGIAFEEVNHEQIAIIILKMDSNLKKNETKIDFISDISKIKNSNKMVELFIGYPKIKPEHNKKINYHGKISLNLMIKLNKWIISEYNEITDKIVQGCLKNSVNLENLLEMKIFRGLYIPNSLKKKLIKGNLNWINKVPDVASYRIKKIDSIDKTDLINKWPIKNRESLKKKIKKIMHPRIFLKVLRGKRLVAIPDITGCILTTEKLTNLILKDKSQDHIFTITAILNSNIVSFFIEKTIFSDTTEISRVMDNTYCAQIPIPKIIKGQKKLKNNPINGTNEFDNLGNLIGKLIGNLYRLIFILSSVDRKTNLEQYHCGESELINKIEEEAELFKQLLDEIIFIAYFHHILQDTKNIDMLYRNIEVFYELSESKYCFDDIIWWNKYIQFIKTKNKNTIECGEWINFLREIVKDLEPFQHYLKYEITLETIQDSTNAKLNSSIFLKYFQNNQLANFYNTIIDYFKPKS